MARSGVSREALVPMSKLMGDRRPAAPYEFTRGSASFVAKSGVSREALVPMSKLTGDRSSAAPYGTHHRAAISNGP